MPFDLAFIWAGLIAFAVLAYVVLDGFDLGVGILFLVVDEQSDRDTAMNSVAPVWDGNETWLILGGGGLFAAFPLAYAIAMPALYAPILAMLLGLIFRGVSFEFRWRTERGKFLWDWGFALGSTLAAFAQGVALGALVQGIPVVDRHYAGGWWDWLTPFSLLTGVAVTVGYATLGSAWLVMKTEHGLRDRMRGIALRGGIALLALIAAVSIWTPFLNPLFLQRWLAWPALLYTAPVPILVVGCAFAYFEGLRRELDYAPFLAALGLFIVSFIGLGISFYPYILPPTITIWMAASPDISLRFMLVGASVLIPLILLYTAVSYWVFRGKVDTAGGYH